MPLQWVVCVTHILGRQFNYRGLGALPERRRNATLTQCNQN